MGFFTQRCPQCSRAVSKEAPHCSGCGCPSANAWASCDRCGASVGSDSKFCWKCGGPQDPSRRDRFYGDRWRRSPGDFAVRVELKTPGRILHGGLQVDDGTLAVVFQAGKLKGILEPGVHSIDGVFARLLGFDKNTEGHAILIDSRAAEADFHLEGVHVKGLVPIDARLRLLFQVAEPKMFVDAVIGENAQFGVADLVARFQGEVRAAVEHALGAYSIDQIVASVAEREVLEASLVEKLQPALTAQGLRVAGVRLARFGGPAYEEFRSKLGELERLTREAEANRALRDALRAEKSAAYRDEQESKDAFERIAQEFGLAAVEREHLRRRFVQAAESQTQLDAARQEYDLRRAEILNRLDEQRHRQVGEVAEARHGIELKRLQFEEDSRQQQERFRLAQEQRAAEARTDLEVARQGVEALKLVRQARLDARKLEDAHEVALEADRLRIRGGASLQALLASLQGEQADRVLKLAELELRKGLSPEQALALIAEKSPEIAPAIAAAVKARAQAPASPAP